MAMKIVKQVGFNQVGSRSFLIRCRILVALVKAMGVTIYRRGTMYVIKSRDGKYINGVYVIHEDSMPMIFGSRKFYENVGPLASPPRGFRWTGKYKYEKDKQANLAHSTERGWCGRPTMYD